MPDALKNPIGKGTLYSITKRSAPRDALFEKPVAPNAVKGYGLISRAEDIPLVAIGEDHLLPEALSDHGVALFLKQHYVMPLEKKRFYVTRKQAAFLRRRIVTDISRLEARSCKIGSFTIASAMLALRWVTAQPRELERHFEEFIEKYGKKCISSSAYTSLLYGYARLGELKEWQRVRTAMKAAGFAEPTEGVYDSALLCTASEVEGREGAATEKMLKILAGLDDDACIPTQAMLLSALKCCRSYQDGVRVLEWFRRRKVVDTSALPLMVEVGLMMTCRWQMQTKKASLLFREFFAIHNRHIPEHYNAVLAVAENDIAECFKISRQMSQNGVVPGLLTYTTLLSAVWREMFRTHAQLPPQTEAFPTPSGLPHEFDKKLRDCTKLAESIALQAFTQGYPNRRVLYTQLSFVYTLGLRHAAHAALQGAQEAQFIVPMSHEFHVNTDILRFYDMRAATVSAPRLLPIFIDRWGASLHLNLPDVKMIRNTPQMSVDDLTMDFKAAPQEEKTVLDSDEYDVFAEGQKTEKATEERTPKRPQKEAVKTLRSLESILSDISGAKPPLQPVAREIPSHKTVQNLLKANAAAIHPPAYRAPLRHSSALTRNFPSPKEIVMKSKLSEVQAREKLLRLVTTTAKRLRG